MTRDDISPLDEPMMTALLKIGRPSVPAVLENLKTTDNTVLRKRSLDVLYHVLGGKRRMIELLQKVAEMEISNRDVALRLKMALDIATNQYDGSHESLY